MIHGKIVFVLGAGASVPYGFPTGKGLVQGILDIKKSDVPGRLQGLMCDAVCGQMGFHRNIVRALQVSLLHSQVASIDEFLSQPAHAGYMEIGRFLIAALLVPMEKSENLFKDGDGPNKNWYQLVWQHLRDYGSIDAIIKHASICFITFNYDRSLEHYLYTVLRHHCEADTTQIERFIENNIFHVHGSLGSYRGIGGAPYRQYLPRTTLDTIKRAMQGIKIVHEVDDFPRHAEIVSRLQDADRIVFLGCQYHGENVRKLFKGISKRSMTIYGTTFGMSRLECATARRRIADMLDMNSDVIQIGDASELGCFDYVREYVAFE
jgi:hypothetical protein